MNQQQLPFSTHYTFFLTEEPPHKFTILETWHNLGFTRILQYRLPGRWLIAHPGQVVNGLKKLLEPLAVNARKPISMHQGEEVFQLSPNLQTKDCLGLMWFGKMEFTELGTMK